MSNFLEVDNIIFSKLFNENTNIPSNVFRNSYTNKLYFPFDSIFDIDYLSMLESFSLNANNKTINSYYSIQNPLLSNKDKIIAKHIKISSHITDAMFDSFILDCSSSDVDDSVITNSNYHIGFDDVGNIVIFASREYCIGIVGWKGSLGINDVEIYDRYKFIFKKPELLEYLIWVYTDKEIAINTYNTLINQY